MGFIVLGGKNYSDLNIGFVIPCAARGKSQEELPVPQVFYL